MSPRLQFFQVATSLFALSYALPNVSPPQITPAPSIGKLEVKRAESGNLTLVGYYTVSSGAPWETNTCGESATWSTSGQYGACAGKPSQSLYTSCSGNVLVGGAGLTTQSCGATWSVCTTLYRATDFQDADPITYLICDVSTGLSKRSVFATTASSASTRLTQPSQSPSASASATPSPSSSGSTASNTASSASATAAAATTTPAPAKKLSGGGIAGIVIGAIALVAIVAAVSLLLSRKRKNKAGQVIGEMEDTSRRPPVELAAEEKLKELPGNESAAELHGSTHMGSTKK